MCTTLGPRCEPRVNAARRSGVDAGQRAAMTASRSSAFTHRGRLEIHHVPGVGNGDRAARPGCAERARPPSRESTARRARRSRRLSERRSARDARTGSAPTAREGRRASSETRCTARPATPDASRAAGVRRAGAKNGCCSHTGFRRGHAVVDRRVLRRCHRHVRLGIPLDPVEQRHRAGPARARDPVRRAPCASTMSPPIDRPTSTASVDAEVIEHSDADPRSARTARRVRASLDLPKPRTS